MGGAVKKIISNPIVATVAGGAIGFFTGGPLGAIRGAAAGYSLSQGSQGAQGGGSGVGTVGQTDIADTGQLATAVGEDAYVPKQYGNRRAGMVLIASDVMNASHKIINEGASGGYATSVYALGEGPWNIINQLNIADVNIFKTNSTINFGTTYSFGNSIFSIDKDFSNLEITFIQGELGQELPDVLARITNADDSRWFRDTDIGNGICYMVLRIKRETDATIRNTAPTNFTIEAQSKKVPDIRLQNSTIKDVYGNYTNAVYSKNPSLIVLDQLRAKEFGLGIRDEDIDFDSFADYADYCDDPGVYPNTKATISDSAVDEITVTDLNDLDLFSDSGAIKNGITGTRYEYTGKDGNKLTGFTTDVSALTGDIYKAVPKFELNGQFGQGANIREMLEEASLCTGAVFNDENGIVTVKIDQIETGTTSVAINENNIVNNISRQEPDTNTLPNVINVKYLDEMGFEVIDVVEFSPAIQNAETRKEADLQLRMVSNQDQALEIAKRILINNRSSNFQFRMNNQGYDIDVFSVSSLSDPLNTDMVATGTKLRIIGVEKERIVQPSTRSPIVVTAVLYNEDVYTTDPMGMSIVPTVKDSDAPGLRNIPRPQNLKITTLSPTTATVTWDNVSQYRTQIEFIDNKDYDSNNINLGWTNAKIVESSPADITFPKEGTYRVSIRFLSTQANIGPGPRAISNPYSSSGLGLRSTNGIVRTDTDTFNPVRSINKYMQIKYADDVNGNGIRFYNGIPKKDIQTLDYSSNLTQKSNVIKNTIYRYSISNSSNSGSNVRSSLPSGESFNISATMTFSTSFTASINSIVGTFGGRSIRLFHNNTSRTVTDQASLNLFMNTVHTINANDSNASTYSNINYSIDTFSFTINNLGVTSNVTLSLPNITVLTTSLIDNSLLTTREFDFDTGNTIYPIKIPATSYASGLTTGTQLLTADKTLIESFATTNNYPIIVGDITNSTIHNPIPVTTAELGIRYKLRMDFTEVDFSNAPTGIDKNDRTLLTATTIGGSYSIVSGKAQQYIGTLNNFEQVANDLATHNNFNTTGKYYIGSPFTAQSNIIEFDLVEGDNFVEASLVDLQRVIDEGEIRISKLGDDTKFLSITNFTITEYSPSKSVEIDLGTRTNITSTNTITQNSGSITPDYTKIESGIGVPSIYTLSNGTDSFQYSSSISDITDSSDVPTILSNFNTLINASSKFTSTNTSNNLTITSVNNELISEFSLNTNNQGQTMDVGNVLFNNFVHTQYGEFGKNTVYRWSIENGSDSRGGGTSTTRAFNFDTSDIVYPIKIPATSYTDHLAGADLIAEDKTLIESFAATNSYDIIVGSPYTTYLANDNLQDTDNETLIFSHKSSNKLVFTRADGQIWTGTQTEWVNSVRKYRNGKITVDGIKFDIKDIALFSLQSSLSTNYYFNVEVDDVSIGNPTVGSTATWAVGKTNIDINLTSSSLTSTNTIVLNTNVISFISEYVRLQGLAPTFYGIRSVTTSITDTPPAVIPTNPELFEWFNISNTSSINPLFPLYRIISEFEPTFSFDKETISGYDIIPSSGEINMSTTTLTNITNLPVNAPDGTPADGSTIIVVGGIFYIAVIIANQTAMNNATRAEGSTIFNANGSSLTVTETVSGSTNIDSQGVYRYTLSNTTWTKLNT